MANLDCQTCGGMGWVESRANGCPACNPPMPALPPRKRRRGVNKQSAKRKEIEAVHAPFREQLKKAVGRCDYCGTVRKASELEEHHIGRNRWREIDNPRRTAIVCRDRVNDCHEAMDSLEVDEQIAVVARAMKRAVRRVMK